MRKIIISFCILFAALSLQAQSVNGIRIDAEEHHPICDITLQNIRYHSIGGVKKTDIPTHYPKVLDQ